MTTFRLRIAALAILAGGALLAIPPSAPAQATVVTTSSANATAASLANTGFPVRGTRIRDAVQARADAMASVQAPARGARTIRLLDGSQVTLGPGGMGVRADANGSHRRPVAVPLPRGQSRIGGAFGPTDDQLRQQLSLTGESAADGSVIVVLSSADIAPTAASTASANSATNSSALTTDAQLDARLRAAGTRTIEPLFRKSKLAASSTTDNGLDLSRVFVARLSGVDAITAARQLRATPGVVYVQPNWRVRTLSVGGRHIPSLNAPAASAPIAATQASSADASLPSNFGVTSSLQSYLNVNGVDAMAAYSKVTSRFGQLPGQGTIITNVCLGDLTDQSMADAGDFYVELNGPTTVVKGGQRYLDIPSMPLIPTYTVDASGNVNPLGTVEFQDPSLGEVLLDFSVMAPLPHDLQRASATGSQFTDLLGIAPGAQYRLVVPSEPTIANILAALQAAAQQSPPPDVITMSLGPTGESVGFPGRYFEDDRLSHQVVTSVVNAGIVVTISANDGTRLISNAAVGPDGGATPTLLAGPSDTPTTIDDDIYSTTPSIVADSGAIAVGGSTLDDVFSSPPSWKRPLSGQSAFPETRLNGGTYYASGFGTRVNVSAPSDNIAVLAHACPTDGSVCTAQSVAAVLQGGTSASAPMTAAASAVLRQVARLTGSDLTPRQVRDLLRRSGRSLPNPPQVDRPIQVGPQIDLAAAVEALLARRDMSDSNPRIVRFGVTHRRELGNLGGDFVEYADPSAIDLMGPYDPYVGTAYGQNSVSPITLAPDVVNRPAGTGVQYRWTIGNQTMSSNSARTLRMLPADILSAAGMSLVSTDTRTVPVTFEIVRGTTVLASSSISLVFGPSEGTYIESLAPIVDPVVPVGRPVDVHYDISNVQALNAPALILSSISHWSPATGALFRTEWTVPLTDLSGTIRVPAAAFKGGAGLYGIGIMTDTSNLFYGQFAATRLSNDDEGDDAIGRPDAPLLAAAGSSAYGHAITITRAQPNFQIRWDASAVAGATGAMLEVSPPGPTIYYLLNTFNNPNGNRRDDNGGDNPSIAYAALPGLSGTTTLDAVKLGVPTSMFYSARVLAVGAGGAVVGQASAVSTIELDDGIAPGAGSITSPTSGYVIDFDVSGRNSSAVAVSQFGFVSGFGSTETSSAVYQYDRAAGAYGGILVSDMTGGTDYHVIGADPKLGLTGVVGLSNIANDEYVDLIDNASRTMVASNHLDVSTQPYLIAGRIDSERHRAAVLGWSSADFSDQILPLDLRTGVLGNPIAADVGTSHGANFSSLDIDRSSGKIFPFGVSMGDLCFLFQSDLITSVDLDALAVQPAGSTSTCITGGTADQKGRTLQMTIGPLTSFILLPDGQQQVVDQATLAASAPTWIGEQSPFFPVVDPENNVLLVGFLATPQYYWNNSASSAIGVFDLSTGNLVKLIRAFNLFGPLGGENYFFPSARGIQIDPKTRTGWTYGPNAAQVQRFSY